MKARLGGPRIHPSHLSKRRPQKWLGNPPPTPSQTTSEGSVRSLSLAFLRNRKRRVLPLVGPAPGPWLRILALRKKQKSGAQVERKIGRNQTGPGTLRRHFVPCAEKKKTCLVFPSPAWLRAFFCFHCVMRLLSVQAMPKHTFGALTSRFIDEEIGAIPRSEPKSSCKAAVF